MKKLLTSAVILAGFGATNAFAFNVGGINLEAGAQFDNVTIFENLVAAPGDELTGYGSINTINGTPLFCTGGGFAGVGGACELTFVFGGYLVDTIAPGSFDFSGGWVNVYADTTPDFNPFTSASQAADIAAASNGTLWLTLAGHEFSALGGSITTSLFGTGTGIGTGADSGTGTGALSVDDTGAANGNTVATAGLANDFFNTDTFADGLGGTYDLTLSTSFNTGSTPNHGETPLSGGGSFAGTVVVPAPATLALLGLGLLGLGAARRRK